jgi:hypothetical protein
VADANGYPEWATVVRANRKKWRGGFVSDAACLPGEYMLGDDIWFWPSPDGLLPPMLVYHHGVLIDRPVREFVDKVLGPGSSIKFVDDFYRERQEANRRRVSEKDDHAHP